MSPERVRREWSALVCSRRQCFLKFYQCLDMRADLFALITCSQMITCLFAFPAPVMINAGLSSYFAIKYAIKYASLTIYSVVFNAFITSYIKAVNVGMSGDRK